MSVKIRKRRRTTLPLLVVAIVYKYHAVIRRHDKSLAAAAFVVPSTTPTATKYLSAATRPSSPVSATKTGRVTSKSLHKVLQKSYTVPDILKNVALELTPENDPSGSLSSLTLVRLSKNLITADNEKYQIRQKELNGDLPVSLLPSSEDVFLMKKGLQNIIQCFVASDWSLSMATADSPVNGIKAAVVIDRILSRDSADFASMTEEVRLSLVDKLYKEDATIASQLKPHHLSGLQWAMDCLQMKSNKIDEKECFQLPPALRQAYKDLKLPFRIRPGFLGSESVLAGFNGPHDAVVEFVQQVEFQSDTIKTTSNRLVKERRQTAWQGDSNVAPFAYSGKSMPRMDWSPIVESIRNDLHQYTSEYYDGCLLNFYPDGESGMRYHIDPDQGSLWGYETAVVSVGATRRFAFRAVGDDASDDTPHTFVLFNGDVTEMHSDCQQRYQHTVKTADTKKEQSSRVSLVFKKTLDDMRT